MIARTEAMFRHVKDGSPKDLSMRLEMVLIANGRAAVDGVLKRAADMLQYVKTGAVEGNQR
jgi:hypothetical protein